MKTAMQELMELNDFLKIMGVTIEWEKYLEKEKEQHQDMFEEGFESAVNGKEFTAFEDYYNETYQNK